MHHVTSCSAWQHARNKPNKYARTLSRVLMLSLPIPTTCSPLKGAVKAKYNLVQFERAVLFNISITYSKLAIKLVIGTEQPF